MEKVEPFKKPNIKTEMKFWTYNEFNKFINTFDNDLTYKTFFSFLYYTGCRIGEALALNFNEQSVKPPVEAPKSNTTLSSKSKLNS